MHADNLLVSRNTENELDEKNRPPANYTLICKAVFQKAEAVI